ncbi:uncharacterized protein [Cicer arietinum]|uniref:uncharacterized protein n=1 Tax=Cicer arietinum TaxID=3827 RepID=UPI003CC6D094
MALQYPLLFPYGEDGYRIGISHRNPETGICYKRKTVTMRQYYSFRLQQRAGEAQTLLRSGRLFQQYMVDTYASIEEVRINWIRKNQKQLHAELYNGLRDAINQGNVMTNSVGRMTILPLSYTGGPRYRVQNYQDAMAICRYAGYPNLFLTFTCNPKWPEIQFFLEIVEGQKSDDRPDIISRVFSIKLWELINDIKRQQIFGKVTAVVYTIEFQKRGLPHAHILVFLHSEDKIQTPSKIDNTISAEIPDKDIDPITFSVVERFMIHGPCGILNKKSPCMVNGKCGKHYPKRFHDKTSIDEDGFPIYMRQNGGRYILKNGSQLDSRYVVPYNRHLLIKDDAHVNVELCNRSRAIKYLFKYINKGPDRVRVVISNVENFDNSSTSSMHFCDEIKEYLDCLLWESNSKLLSEDILYRKRRLLNFLDLHLEDYKGIAIPNSNLLHGLNSDQKAIHDFVLQSITLNFGKLFFVYGSGGTGKTYLWRTLLAKLRSEGKIALAIATSDIAELIMQTSLIIWDEAPMANKYCFEAVDRSLRDIMKGIKEDYGLKPFGGITIVLGGNFRQILPVVRKGDRHDMIQACIKNPYLWNSCEVHLIRQNMRLQSNELDSISKDAMQNFADWILDVGDGKQCSNIGESWISIEQNLMLPKSHDDFQSIVDAIYPN